MRRLLFALAWLVCASVASAQVPVAIAPVPRQQFSDVTGTPLAGGLVFTYIAGTTTPQATYVDAGGLVQNTNPIVLDSGGFATIWLAAAPYKMCVQNSLGAQQWCVDNINQFGILNGNTWLTSQTFQAAMNANGGGNFSGTFTGNPTLTGNIIFSGSNTHTGPETFPNINGWRWVDGVQYPQTVAGFQQAINDLLAGCQGGVVVVPPGTVITASTIATDANGQHVILIDSSGCGAAANPAPSIWVLGYGATINYTAGIGTARIMEVRSADHVQIDGFTLTSSGQIGTGLSFRKPSNLDPGPVTIHDVARHMQIIGFNIGVEMGVAGEGEVDTNRIEQSIITDCATGVLQDGSTTEENIYEHLLVQSFNVPNAILYKLNQVSATLISPVTGGTALGLVHLQIGLGMRNVVIEQPHFEVSQNANPADTGAMAINWLGNTIPPYVTVQGGSISDFRPSGTSPLIKMNNPTTNGMMIMNNTVVFRAGGTASITVGNGPFLFSNGGAWTNTSLIPDGPFVMGANGNPGSFFGSFSAQRRFGMPDTSGTVVLDTASQVLTNKTEVSPIISGGIPNTAPATGNTGYQHLRVAGCTTSTTNLSFCDVTVTWAAPFLDTNYTAVCVGSGAEIGGPVLEGIAASAAKTASAITVRTLNVTGSTASSFATIECIASHD